jgi:hypothetical protein
MMWRDLLSPPSRYKFLFCPERLRIQKKVIKILVENTL